MGKKPSQRISLPSLSKATGVRETDLQLVLDDLYHYQLVRFDSQQTVIESAPEIEPDEKINFFQKKQKPIIESIEEADGFESLWRILCRLSYDDPEYVICYDKLVSKLEIELNKTSDEDELQELYKSSPRGSDIEKAILSKLNELRKTEVANEDDFEALIELYKKDEFEGLILDILVEKILKIISSPSEAKQLLDDVFPENSIYYYTARSRHSELLQKAIAEMNDIDDAGELYDLILNHGDDEEILLAERIVALSKNDPEAIWSKEDVFENDSEAKEILALGAIIATTEYDEEQNDTIHSIASDFESHSRIGRAANKKISVLFLNHIQSLTDVDEIKNLLERFEDGEPNRKLTEEHIIELCGEDELKQIIEDDNEHYLTDLAIQKEDIVIRDAILKAKRVSDISEYENSIDQDDDPEMANELFEKIVSLCKNRDDIDGVTIPDQSYTMYLFAKKFPADKKVVVEPVAEVIPLVINDVVSDQVVSPDDQKKKQDETRNAIKKMTDSAEAMLLCNMIPVGDSNKRNAYQKASDLLSAELQTSVDIPRLRYLCKMFPKGSNEWGSIIKALSKGYEKPWYQFW